jgi:hypothetical protein
MARYAVQSKISFKIGVLGIHRVKLYNVWE